MELKLTVFVLPSSSLVFFPGPVGGDLLSPTSRPRLAPRLLFTPDSLEGMYGRPEKGRAGGLVERKGRFRTHKTNDQCKKKRDTIYSQETPLDRVGDSARKKRIHRTQSQSRRQKQFSMSLFYPVDPFSLFYQGCDSKGSKNQQLKKKIWVYTVYSTISITTLQPKTTLSHSFCFWFWSR